MFRNSFLSNRNWNAFILTAAIIYAMIMIKLLFVRHSSGYASNGYSYNLVPFSTIKNYILHRNRFNTETWVKNLFGNIVLFIPLGVLGPLLNIKLFKKTLFLEVIISLLFGVELIQLFTQVGSFDVDDIILNTFGALLGLLFTSLLRYTVE